MRLLKRSLAAVCLFLLTAALGTGCAGKEVNVSINNVIVGNGDINTRVSETEEPSTAGKGDGTDGSGEMSVHFIDVGQGDATLVVCGGHAMLIDAGDGSVGTLVQNYLQKQGVSKLDYLILTHPDADHIGAAPVIITKFDIDTVLMSDYEKDNMTYRKLIQALDDKRLKYETPSVGAVYSLGEASFTILGPNGGYTDPNNASVALLLEHGANTFLFTGDAEEEAEEDILNSGIGIHADVYQAGHHGSRTSSSQAFLDAVSPEYAVISCGQDNEYGHPHAQTLNSFRKMGTRVFRTDEQGSIVAGSDGKEIKWNAAPSDTWKAGEPTGGGQKNTQTELTYILNTKTKKFHRPECSSLPTTNRADSSLGRDEIISQGYVPCKKCSP